MKKQITLITLAALSTAAVANAQDFIAGWDFNGLNVGAFGSSLGTTVVGGAADSTAFLQVDDANGLAQVVSRGQAPAAGTVQALNGFETFGTRSYLDPIPTGQQGLEFSQYAGDFSFTVDFGGTLDDAIIDFAVVASDTATLQTNGFSVIDIVGVSYSVGGNSTTYGNGNFFGDTDSYLAQVGTGWTASQVALGQPGTIDLSNIAGVESVTFTIKGNSELVAFDNIAVQGVNYTPVPEPSTYAAIAGVLALGFVAYRRRK